MTLGLFCPFTLAPPPASAVFFAVDMQGRADARLRLLVGVRLDFLL